MKNWTQRLYFAAPVWVQNLLTNAYGVHLRRLRYGEAQQRVLGELLASERAPAEAIHNGQLASLRTVVRHAFGTVPVYRDRGIPAGHMIESLADIRSLPLLSKDDLRRPREEVISSQFRNSKLEVIHTGGTTGKPLSIFCDRPTLQRNYAFYGRLLAWAGIEGRDRIAVFAGRTIVPPGQRKPPYWRTNRPNNALLFSSYHISAASLPHYAAALAAFQPALIDSYPSSLAAVARYALQAGIGSIRPRAVITSSETLTDEVRRDAELAFGCRVFDQYGGAEMAAFISQCELGRYHVNPEFGLVEILNEGVPAGPGEIGEIVATGFINPVMPLIRYATGDLAAVDDSPCGCGRAFPTIGRIIGRLDDVLETPEGRFIGRLDPIFKSAATIHESRIVQDAFDHVRLEIVPKGELPDVERNDLLRELRARLGPSMRVDIVKVASLPRTRSGKLRMVVNEVKRRS